MVLILTAVVLLILCGAAALVFRSSSALAPRIGVAGPVLACIVGLIPAIRVLSGAAIDPIRLRWDMPLGSFSIGMDSLSAFFLLPILALGALAAIYGFGYLKPYLERKSPGVSWFQFNMLVASMVMVVLARNALLFLVAWEVMSLTSFFLVAFENEKSEVRKASWTYMIATHIGTAFLFVMFLLLGQSADSLEFGSLGNLTPHLSGVCFVLAVIGFGTKAGIIPSHVWLPEAHPAAPSHVSALMSGVMIKTGIYGIVRVLDFLGPAPMWWGWGLIAIGLLSGVLGVLFALAQHDLKRLLAYHSVENIGIIVMGIGVGVLGLSAGSPTLTFFGFAGGLLHVLNHAMFKGLLFMGAGAVAHAAHTREIDHLGGLLKRMPWTGAAFLTGAVAISGLPPLNGFVSEFLIYLGSFKGAAGGAASLGGGIAVALLFVIAGLALIGGLATACFTKAFGMVFLGEPRSEHPGHAQEAGRSMVVPMVVLAAGCFAIGLLGFLPIQAMPGVIAGFSAATVGGGFDPAAIRTEALAASGYLKAIALGACLILLLTGLIALLRRWLLSGRTVEKAGTWDCGYAAPTARMQYTASSFAQPILDFFNVFQSGWKRLKAPRGYFPVTASFETEALDTSQEKVYRPLFEAIERFLSKLRVMQHGRIQLYVLYIVLTLAFLIAWKLR
jgi:formate hydrogenlyase subunit 3/multisubunit Na+/H+ antiporter MnhD subunit